jgi:hypothetical protein
MVSVEAPVGTTFSRGIPCVFVLLPCIAIAFLCSCPERYCSLFSTGTKGCMGALVSSGLTVLIRALCMLEPSVLKLKHQFQFQLQPFQF